MFIFKPLLPPAGLRLFAAAALALSLLSGCQKGSQNPAPGAADGKAAQARPTPAPAPEANIYVDEARLAKPYAVIGGAVENVGGQALGDLSVEIELRRRDDGAVERRNVALTPGDLQPGQRGKFSLKVLSEEWVSSRVVGLRSGARAGEVAFKSLPGAKRPPEKVKPNVVTAGPPARKKSDGSDFINTPDTPYSVP